ncbi:MAG: formylglycine-generating enzyme family protein [Polyangiaceae bacterium]|nr:formylglycine-generating enzyme family protein [Polyangiaceae bacterium]
MAENAEPRRVRRTLIAFGGLAVLGLGAALALVGRTPGGRSDTGRPGMVRIPAGTFQMGTDSGLADERPAHPVTLPSFEMDVTEVTVAQYRACVAANACQPAATVKQEGFSSAVEKALSRFCNASRNGREQHPLNCVDWSQASTYCKWAGKRLPTEEEWEYAARGTDGRTYPWGNEAPGPERLNACGVQCQEMATSQGWKWPSMYAGDDGFADTAPVGSFPKGRSPFGVLDMAGNVWEWTHTEHCNSYAKDTKCTDHRSIRGGSWSDGNRGYVRAAYRNGRLPAERSIYVGFRCVR